MRASLFLIIKGAVTTSMWISLFQYYIGEYCFHSVFVDACLDNGVL